MRSVAGALAGAVLLCAVAAPQRAAGGCSGNTSFLVGSGVYDVTGPAAEVTMLGYAMIHQRTAGIHTRLRSRAFVIASPCNDKRVALVTVDVAMITQAVQQAVMARLKSKFGDLYTEQNVLLAATHTHSGPGGYSHYTLYNLTILGFDRDNFNAIVDGIYRSIARAHDNLGEGEITWAAGEVENASINRSPEAYERNPESERARYAAEVDRQMLLLRLRKKSGKEIGVINWFAVHATSMGNENHLISSDNKGCAEYLFEKEMGTDYTAEETFVAAFAQGNEGDTSPNIHGGEDGGGDDDFASTLISGTKQYRTARELYARASEPLSGGVDYRQTYVKMDEVDVSPELTDGRPQRTCPAAIGISMLAGAEDGRGFGYEGVTCNDLATRWQEFTCWATTTPCQGEKPIALEMGNKKPYPWTPEVLPIQIVTIGDVAIVALAHEVATMAGRRLRDTVLGELGPAGIRRVVVASLANAYAGYIVTREEYAAQHYEGASTHFGPWSLAALQQEARRLAAALRQGKAVPRGPKPRDLSHLQLTLITGVLFDDVPLGSRFGDVVQDAESGYARGDTVRVTFWGAHLRNDFRLQDSYLEVQRKSAGGWVAVAHDWDWETKLLWRREHCLPTLACSHVTVEWSIPNDATPGTYRIRHDGAWKPGLNQDVRRYAGYSREFTVR